MQQDYKSPWWRTFKQMETDRQVNILTAFASLSGLALLIWMITASCVDGVIREAERQEEYEPRPVYASQTYQRPAAFHKATPTQQEMDHLHHLMVIQEVRR
jgi:hypothetical protein